MILSMTGFGSSRVDAGGASITVEARTVNHRYLDLHVRLAPEFQSLEPVVRRAASSKLARGRADLFVKIERTRPDVRIDARPDLIGAYVELVRELKSRFPISGELTVEALSRLPGAIQVADRDPSREQQDALASGVERATLEALDGVRGMRAREGEAMVADMRARSDTIRERLGVIRESAPVLLDHYRERLAVRVAELAPNLDVNPERLEIEALMLAEKSDIAEEVTRLESHLDQFDAVLMREAEAGKRLDFLLQEMNREVSTILSKTSGLNRTGASIGEAGIDIRVEIDKLREQVQNVE